jgi:outer membrane protein assembly factor BamD (BamD/ComL family)
LLGAFGVAIGTPSVAVSQPAATPPAAGTGAAAPAGSAVAPSAGALPAAPGPTASAASPTHAAPTVKLKKGPPPPPPPSAAQLRAFEILKQEAKEYEKGAKEFRDTLTMIVRHHYEERRRRILNTLDREIGIEKRGLKEARAEAIKRLEAFIALYSGENAHPSATPDAMFRLAALYEERAREALEGDLSAGLEPAIALYRRIIDEYPQYEEMAAVHYFLGHAYTDSTRIEEGQQAWRALVCNNRYQVKADPKDSAKIQLQPLEQDHDQKFWDDWNNKHPVPLDGGALGKGMKKPAPKPVAKGKGKAAPAGTAEEELSYRDPYPLDCKPLPQQLRFGEDPRYLAEIWWQIGNNHFDQIDPNGGPYNLNRAVSAYGHSMQFKKPPVYGVSMYKLAWTYFKQQRYKTAVDEFVKLLHHADELEAKTGDPGADFRQEAFTYIAGSLTYVDFEGPPGDHPYIPRNDVLDTEPNPLVAEEKMAIGIQRVQDPALIPQDKKWTVEIYKALAQEFIEITQNRNAIATLELTLKKFPMDRDAPVMQNRVAELYDQLTRLAPEGSPAKAEYAAKALEARTKLAAYVGATPWTDANRDDPEALAQAEQLVKGGLRRAAADHTNAARIFYNRALELTNPGEQRAQLEKSIDEYRLAETGWAGYLNQDPNALDAYESKFWLADARYWVVVLQVAINRSPKPDEIQRAREASVAVRDSNEDDKYLQPTGYYLVTMAEKILEDEYRKFEESKGAQGIEKRDEVRFNGEDPATRTVVKDPLPAPILEAVKARDEYNARIPVERDPKQNGLLYAFQNAEYFFIYGDFAGARPRYQALYDQYCGKNEWGYKSWDKLISMAALERDAATAKKLAQGKSCAYSEETKKEEEGRRKPIMQTAAYQDASALFEKAQKMPDGPERQKTWREAAAAYKVALDAAPDRDEAPEAAMNGAYAYKQVGEYDKAIEMYELFISKYGSETILQKLKNGDPKAKPPVSPDPKRYEARVKFLKTAYDALASSYVLFFDYPKAAQTFDKISSIDHFDPNSRRESAKQALSLYSSLGDQSAMQKMRDRFKGLGASPKEIAEADFIIASSDLKKWDEYSPDTGGNATARKQAQASMGAYYEANRKKSEAAQYVVHAAYHVAKMKAAVDAGDTNKWWRQTMEAWDAYKKVAPTKDGKNSAIGSPEATMAAQAEYTMLDEEITKKFDYESGHHRFKGTPVKVIEAYRKDATVAKQWYDKLQVVIDKYVSPEYTTVAVSRQGTLYDSLRTGLYNVRPPELVMFDKKQETMLKKAEESDNPDLQEKADAIRVKVQQAWRDARDKEINGADEIMVDRYGNAIMLSRRYNVSHPGVVHAIRRLAFFTDVIGEAKMKQFTTKVKDLNYTEGMFLKMRPGQVTRPEADGMPRPLPVLSQ